MISLDPIRALPHHAQVEILLAMLEEISGLSYWARQTLLAIDKTQEPVAFEMLNKREHDAVMIKEHIKTLFQKQNTMNTYFIEITFYQTKNNLEKVLQNSFKCFDRKTITENKISLIKTTFDDAVAFYKNGGGKATATIESNSYSENSTRYDIKNNQNTSMFITLIKIKGEI